MKLKEFNIVDILPETITDQFDFKGVYVDAGGNSHNLTIFDTAYFIMHLYQLQTTRKIMADALAPAVHLVSLFQIWRNSRADLFLKQAYAYTLKYNPIENYSSLEKLTDDITTHEKGTKTERTYDQAKDKTTITPYEKETVETTPYAKETTETTPYQLEKTETKPTNYATTHSKKAFNSADWSDTDKDIQSGSEAVEKTFQGTEKVEHYYEEGDTTKTEKSYTGNHVTTVEHLGKTTDAESGTDTDRHQYTLTKSGNIGVLTPSEMLAKEFSGLVQDLAFRAFSEFIDRFTYYAEGVI